MLGEGACPNDGKIFDGVSGQIIHHPLLQGYMIVRRSLKNPQRVRRRITGHEKRVVAARQQWKCALCDLLLHATFEVDHILALHRGGADEIDNCHALCRPCDSEKTQREEIARLRLLYEAKRLSATRLRRPPLVCTRCNFVVAPYFTHTCNIGE